MKTVCLTHLKKNKGIKLIFTTTADDAEAAAKKAKRID